MAGKWTLGSDSLAIPSCRVLALNGKDALMHGYDFDILFATAVTAQDAPDFLKKLVKATHLALSVSVAKDESFTWNGLAAKATYLFTAHGNSVFRVNLKPRCHALFLNAHSRIFLQMSLPQIVEKVLQEEDLVQGNDFSGKLGTSYPARPYTCQYNESSASFLARHLERAGAYTYIAQKNGADVLVLADADTALEKLPIRDSLEWGEGRADETLFYLNRTLSTMPTKVTLRDYCTEQPGMVAKSALDADHLNGGKELNLYAGQNVYGDVDFESGKAIVEDAQDAAAKLAGVRVRSLVTEAHRVEGGSAIPWLQPGYTMTLGSEEFQLVSVRHSGVFAEDALEERMVRQARQAGFIPGIAQGYSNEFVCHPTEVGTYAPPLHTPRPTIAGLVHAQVDASGDGQYAELDSHGRYKVNFFFPEKVIHKDADDPSDGNRSIPLRMAQAHVGSASGIHFPLLKGAEVLVGFTDGDPDRPLILSAMPNPEHPSVVAEDNHQLNMIQTPGGHSISMTDTEGEKNMTLGTPGGSKVIMHDEIGKKELRLQFGGHYLRLTEE